MSDRQLHMAIAKEKLRLFLGLSEELLALRNEVQNAVDIAVRTGKIADTRRNSVLVGLSMKALDSFDRLIVDARDSRGECSHHLKTMVECFIYSHWVTADASDKKATILMAESCRSRAVYHENCSQSAQDKEAAGEWRKLQQNLTSGLEKEWKAFKDAGLVDLASEARIEEHYYRIYRLACEAAHTGDLYVYMPPQPEEGGLTVSDLSLLRAYTSLKFGISLACDLLHDASDALNLELDQQINGFRKRSDEIRLMG